MSSASDIGYREAKLAEALLFPGGPVAKAKPSREALENSLESWAAVTVMNAQIVHREPSAVNVRGLKSSVATLERILAELETL